MSKVDFKSGKAILKDILPDLLCSKCKKIPLKRSPEWKQQDECFNDRYRCTDCPNAFCFYCVSIVGEPKCTCGRKLPKRPCPLVRKLVQMLPVHCRYFDEGCQEAYQEALEARNHERVCTFRRIPCVFGKCKEKVPHFCFIEHILEHDKFAIKDLEFGAFEGDVLCRKIKSGYEEIYVLNMSDQAHFIFKVKEENRFLNISMSFLGCKEEAEDFRCEILTIGSSDEEVVYKGFVSSLEEHNPFKFGLSISTDDAKRMAIGGSLKFYGRIKNLTEDDNPDNEQD